MNSISIVSVDPLTHFAEAVAQEPLLQDADIEFSSKSPVDENETIERCKNATIVVTNVTTLFNEKVLSSLPQLRTLITASIGTNHIDLEYCEQHNVTVINFPGFCASAVAEASFGYMLSLIRMISAAENNIAANKFDTQSFWGTELRGKTLGVIGAGDIGKYLMEIGRGFGMNVLCHTAHPSRERAQTLGLEKFTTKEGLLQQSDFVVLAIPVTDETVNYISTEEIALMKNDAYLVNVARHQLVNLDAIAQAINEKTIGGFATDVPGPEPFYLRDQTVDVQRAYSSSRVLVVPHIAANTLESDENLYNRMIVELKSLISQ